MSDNYAVINGKRIKLTDEQVKSLGLERKNPFERVNRDVDDKYYYIRVSGDVSDHCDVNDNADKLLYKVSNYFNDKDHGAAYYPIGQGDKAQVIEEPIYGLAIKNGKHYIIDECGDFYEIGEEVFLTKEAAEKEVERRKKNEL